MTQRRLTRTTAAEADLTSLWAYIAADNEPAANRLLERIETASKRLVEFPELGRSHDDVRSGLRLFAVGNYLLLFRRTEEGVEIVRVLHGKRNWRALLLEGPDQ